MNTVLYLANQQIQVVIGSPGENKISVERYYEAEAPEGSIINGMVMDTELFVGFMKEFWAANKLPTKDVTLVINSSKFVGKTIEMPELSMKKAYEYIAREFTDVNRNENSLYSYLPLGSGTGKMKRVYVEGISPDFIHDYIELFNEIGIGLKCILSGESSLIGLTAMTTGRAYQNFALIIADSSILTTILWIDGSFYYFNSMRCFHDRETEDYAGDVARSVSQITQFMQAHQLEQRLESIVIAGIEHYNLPMYKRAIEQMGILTPVQLFEAMSLVSSQQIDIQKCLRAASGLVTGGKYLNLLKHYSMDLKKKGKKDKSIEINVVPVIVSAVILIISISVAMVIKITKQKELDKLEEYNNSPQVLNSVAAYDMLSLKNGYLYAQSNAVDSIIENINTYPIFDSKVMAKIEASAKGYATVTFEAFDATQGTIQMTASSESVDKINSFIKALTELDIFNSVDYTGYAFNDTTAAWDIHVTCTLAESAGR